MTGTGCQDLMTVYCSGADILDDSPIDWSNEMQKRWDPTSTESCVYAVNRNLFGNPNTTGLFSQVPINPCEFTKDRKSVV